VCADDRVSCEVQEERRLQRAEQRKYRSARSVPGMSAFVRQRYQVDRPNIRTDINSRILQLPPPPWALNKLYASGKISGVVWHRLRSHIDAAYCELFSLQCYLHIKELTLFCLHLPTDRITQKIGRRILTIFFTPVGCVTRNN